MCLSTSHTCLFPSIFCCSCLGPADIGRVGTAHQSSQWTPTLLWFWIDFELNLNWGLYLRMFSSLWVYEQRKTRVFSQILHKCHFSSQGKIQEIQRIIDTLLVLRKRIVLRIEVNQFESPFKFLSLSILSLGYFFLTAYLYSMALNRQMTSCSGGDALQLQGLAGDNASLMTLPSAC